MNKENKPFRMPKFVYSRKKYQSYIYFGAFDHEKGKLFMDKIRDISPYSKFSGFDALREHFGDRKLEVVEYVNQHILPLVNEAVVSGQLDKGIQNKNWTSLLQRRQSVEFISIKILIQEYIQNRYLGNDSISNKDLYKNALEAFADSLQVVLGKSTFNSITIKEITEGHCQQVFDNWAQFRYSNSNTRRIYRDKVKKFFDAFIDIIKLNPVTKKTLIKNQGKSRNIPLLDVDLKKILSHLENKDRKKYKELLAFCLLMFTGLMRGDTILRLRGSNLKKGKDEAYFIEVYTDMIKTKEPGNVIIPKYVVDYLIENGIYDPANPDKLLFPPNCKERPSRETVRNKQRKSGHLRNRMWASNLWTDILKNELGYSREFIRQHNIYCLKATGALFLFNIEKWDIREISAQMLHAHLITTFIYIEKLRLHNVDPNKRKFTYRLIGVEPENKVNILSEKLFQCRTDETQGIIIPVIPPNNQAKETRASA